MVSAIIMAGGGGSRFWPKSRKIFPKQCIAMTSMNSMAEETAERLKLLTPKENIYISTGKHLADVMRDLPLLKGTHFILEPIARSTTAAIGLSLMKIDSLKKDEIVLQEAADHFIRDPEEWLKYTKKAVEEAEKGKIVLIGIKPSRAETGYGYIKKGEEIEKSWIEISSVESFKEKPDDIKAKEYVESGKYLWNANMFVTKTSVMLEEIRKNKPEIYASLEKIRDHDFDENIIRQEFEKMESIAIDYSVMEKSTDKLVVITGDFHWDDLGDWASMERVLELDNENNAVDANVQGDNENCVIFGDEKIINMDGFKDMIVIDTKDALLAAKKNRAQDVKKIVEIIEKDEGLKKYFSDFVENPEFKHIQIDCEEVEVKSSKLVATIGLENISIEENDEKIIIKKV